MRCRSVIVPLVVLGLTGSTSCGGTERHDSGPKRSTPPAGGLPKQRSAIVAATPEAAVLAYVEAIDRRDGDRYCRVVAPWIATHLDVLGKRQAELREHHASCERLVKWFIGYVEDCCPPEFRHVRIDTIGRPSTEGDTTRVPVRLRLTVQEQQRAPHEVPLDDVVWLVHRDGGWRVAWPSALAHAVSIGFDFGQPGDDPRARPDVARLEQDARKDVAALRRQERARSASYRPLAKRIPCAGGLAFDDPPRDRSGHTPGQPLPAAADLRHAALSVHDGGLCFSVKLAGVPRQPISIVLSASNQHDTAHLATRQIVAEVRPDGTGRLTSGTDDANNPIVIPGRVAADGARITVALDRQDLEAARRTQPPITAAPLRLTRFSFQIAVQTRAGDDRLDDAIGDPRRMERIVYPDAGRCSTSEDCP